MHSSALPMHGTAITRTCTTRARVGEIQPRRYTLKVPLQTARGKSKRGKTSSYALLRCLVHCLPHSLPRSCQAYEEIKKQRWRRPHGKKKTRASDFFGRCIEAVQQYNRCARRPVLCLAVLFLPCLIPTSTKATFALLKDRAKVFGSRTPETR